MIPTGRLTFTLRLMGGRESESITGVAMDTCQILSCCWIVGLLVRRASKKSFRRLGFVDGYQQKRRRRCWDSGGWETHEGDFDAVLSNYGLSPRGTWFSVQQIFQGPE